MTETERDDWTVTLIAYANGTLDAAERADVETAMASSDELRRELVEIETLRRAVRRDDAPPTIPAAVWERIEADGIQQREAAPWPPPAARTPPPPPPTGDVVVPLRPRRRRFATAVVGAAAAALLVVAGAVVLTRGNGEEEPEAGPTPTTAPGVGAAPTSPTNGDNGATESPPNALEAPAPQALMSTQVAMVAARTATLDVSGRGVATFDGSLFGEEGDAEVVLDLTGDGEVDFGDGSPNSSAYRLTIAMEAVSGPEVARPEDTEWETIVVDGRSYSNENGGPYTEEDASADPDEQGLFAQIALSPDVLARLPELADGEIDDLGVERLDAVDVRHLRFDVKPSPGDDPDDEQEIEVWIDDSGVVRKMRVIQSGPLELDVIDDGEIAVDLDIDLENFGAPVEITAPS